MKTITNKLSVVLLTLVLFLQPFMPLATYAQTQTDQSHQPDTVNLYQTTEAITADAPAITIDEGTFLYGTASETNDDTIEIEFADTTITISATAVEEVDETTEQAIPTYIDTPATEAMETITLEEGQALFAIHADNETPQLELTEDTTLPVTEDEQGTTVILIGNIAFYLNETDRNQARELAPEVEKEKELETETNEEIEQVEPAQPSVDSNANEIIEEQAEPEEEIQKEINTVKQSITQQTEAIEPGNYFRVNEAALPVYAKGNTKIIGTLTEGAIYPVDADYGNWYQIQFGNVKGYVLKSRTTPANGTSLHNENHNFTNSNRHFIARTDVTVYDNSSGELVPFAQINAGERYPIVSDYGSNWSRIIFADRVGYILNSQVRFEFTGNEDYFTVLTSNLPVYDNRSGSLKEVATLTRGQVYKIVSDYGNWHRIQYNNHYGYVQKSQTQPASGTYVRNKNTNLTHSNRSFTTLKDTIVYDNSSGSLRAFGTIRAGQPYRIASDYGNWWRIIYGDRIGYVQKSNVREEFTGNERYFQVLKSDLPVYDNRTGSLVKIGSLTKGQAYEIVADYGNWHRIQFNDHYGYVRKSDTTPGRGNAINNKATSQNHSNQTFLTMQDMIVYDNSSGKLRGFGKIDQGQVYRIVRDYGAWWEVIFAGRIGYVHKSGVQLINQATDNSDGFMVTEDAFLSILKDNKRIYVATLKQGETFQKIGERGNWLHVNYGGQTGYVWKPATVPVNFNFTQKPTIAERYAMIDVPLYSSTNKREVVAIAEAGESLQQTRKVNANWMEVNFAGRILYAEAKYITDLDTLTFDVQENEHFDALNRNMMTSAFIYDNPNTPENETLEHANLILQDIIRFPQFDNGTPMNYQNGIDWTRGKGVNSEHQRSFLRQLHGLFFINDLIQAYHMTDDARYIRKGYDLINKWKIANPYHNPAHQMAWHDEGTARRLSTLVNFFETGKHVLTETQKRELFNLMVIHANLLSEEHFYSRNTNHGMFQDEALIVFSKYFEHLGIFTDYYNLALERMSGYFDNLISDDGVHLEHSPAYHQTIAGSLNSYANTLNQIGDHAAASYFTNKYNGLVDYATHVLKPNGKWPLIADTYARSNPLASLWPDNPFYQYAVTNGQRGVAPQETNAVFPDAGYAIFRDQWETPNEGAYVFFTAAYHTNYHKHSDDLSLWIYDGQDIITEAGPHSYTLSDPVTAYAYSSFGHNTLIVDDKGLPRVDGKFAQTYLEDYDIDNALHPSATGVNKRYNGVTHRRNINFDKTNRIIEVNDEMISQDNHNYKLLWHLAPDIIPEIDERNDRIILRRNGEIVTTIHLASEQTLKMKAVYGNEDATYKGWTFDNRVGSDPIDTHVIIVETDSDSAEIQTRFELPKR